ncbi:MAG: transporter ATP-binding protein [Mucilaginibacter sp.]|nr:transporter ATP-binding protein [Mucilaginibacter sp.]
MRDKFPFYKQLDYRDCGPTCLQMISKHYGKNISREYLRSIAGITRIGVTMGGISDAAENIGFRTLGMKVSFSQLIKDIPVPCIIPWKQNHFVVIYNVTDGEIWIADPAKNKIKYSYDDFLNNWTTLDNTGYVLVLNPTNDFYSLNLKDKNSRKGIRFLIPYLKTYKKSIAQIFVGLILGSAIQFVMPFLIRAIVDVGIKDKNISFIYLILTAQIFLFFSQTLIQIFREWIVLHITSKLNIRMVSDFLYKVLNLPISYFETRNTGEHLQRITDHRRVQDFVGTASFSLVYSILLFVIFNIILLQYNLKIFAVFFIGAIAFISWTLFFLRRRAEIDYRRSDEQAESQAALVQIINGVNDIKLNNSQQKNRWKWELVQVRLFKTSIKSLSLTQVQTIGSGFINELKNILITFLCAYSVIKGDITIGVMMSIQYVVGQLNVPLNDFIRYIQLWQDAKLSIERLNQVHNNEDEDFGHKKQNIELKGKDIVFDNLWFRYGGNTTPFILKNLNCVFPNGKVTAIVGASGSGKTTLLKLLLKFNEPTQGAILVDENDLKTINNNYWRMHCGAVLQETFVFDDTILGNISESEQTDRINFKMIEDASEIANVTEFVSRLPNNYNTTIGASGLVLSGGQIQRLMIARAVYKNPEFIFFDEATSSLDANNEKIIMENLDKFMKNRTSVIIAHRLSTVKNADKIIVLENGEIVEEGNHQSLTEKRGKYFELVKNQLELGG